MIAAHVSEDFKNIQVAALGTGCETRAKYQERLREFLLVMVGLVYESENIVQEDDLGETGCVEWPPGPEDLGAHDFCVRISDGDGGVSDRCWPVNVVENPNSPAAFAGEDIEIEPCSARLCCQGTDPRGMALSYEWTFDSLPEDSMLTAEDITMPDDDPDTRTIAAYVEYDQQDGEAPYLAPGLFVRGEISGAMEEGRWIVPRRAVKDDRLLLVEEGQVVSRPVVVAHFITGRFDEFGLPDTDWIVLQTPLSEGDSVILNPTRALFDGLAVKEISAAEAMAAARRSTEEEEQVQ